MKLPGLVLVSVLCAAVGGIVIAGRHGFGKCPLELRIVRAEPVSGPADGQKGMKLLLTMDNRGSQACSFAGKQGIQLRNRGRWQPAEDFPLLAQIFLPPHTNRQELSFVVPAQTEACRFLVTYRVGMSPYCRAYFFLERHGIPRTFPRFSKWVLGWFRGRTGDRRATFDLDLPPAADARPSSTSAGLARLHADRHPPVSHPGPGTTSN